MANVLTDLAADLYKSADVVARELVGAIPSIVVNGGSERVAQNDVIRSHFTRPPVVNTTYTPSMTIPEGDDQTIDNKQLTIDKVANVQIPWTGEEIAHVDNGSGFSTVYDDQMAQAFRGITNQIEADVLTAAYQGASRAFGTPGTTPFGSNFDEVAKIRQILVDNGMPDNRMATLVINTDAGTNLRNLAQLQKANEAGNDRLLRQGTLLDLQNLMIKESAGVQSHTAGTGTGYLVNNGAGYAVGDTAIDVDTGTGTILAGDYITFTGDTNKYVVETALTGGTVTIAEPGLRKALADNTAVTVAASAVKNVAFHRNAIELAARPPKQPKGGDAAVDRMTIQDPRSGLVYEIAAYKGYGKMMLDVTVLYGIKVWLPKYVAQLVG